MKKSDLFREWARVIDMCEGTGVEPIECLRIDGTPCRLKNPLFFNDDPECYTFAVAILEGTPLFVGDEVYWKIDREKFDWDKCELSHADYYQNLTRTPPERTITLNGEKLPASDNGRFCLYVAGFGDRKYYFENHDDLIKVEAALNKLLSGE